MTSGVGNQPGRDEELVQRLQYRVRQEFSEPGLIHAETAVVKNGPRAYKTVSLLTYGDPESGRVSGRTFRVQTWNAHAYEGGYDFSRAANSWSCDDHEMAVIQAFLNAEFAAPGDYLLIHATSGAGQLLAQLGVDRLLTPTCGLS